MIHLCSGFGDCDCDGIGGRGSDQGNVVGDVILHGKKKYWVRGGNFHYHLGLKAGENTHEANIARELTKSLSENAGEWNAKDFTDRYIKFMTTPGVNTDTYASTCHRMFFANWMQGVPPEQCAANDGHNTDAIDALTLTVPLTLQYADAPEAERNAKLIELINITRKTRALDKYAIAFSNMLIAVLNGKGLREAVEECGHKNFNYSVKLMVESSRGDPMVACYIDSSVRTYVCTYCTHIIHKHLHTCLMYSSLPRI